MGEQYLTESKVWELYKRIEDVTKQQLDTGHPKIDDIVIENNGKKLIGKCGCSGLIYEWLNRNEVLADFKPEYKVSIKEREELLKILESYYGEPTRFEDGEGLTTRDNANKLVYEIIIGERIIQESYYDGTTNGEKENITRILALRINPSSFIHFHLSKQSLRR